MFETIAPNQESNLSPSADFPKPQSLLEHWRRQIPSFSLKDIPGWVSPLHHPGVWPNLTDEAHNFVRMTGISPEIGTFIVVATVATGAISFAIDYLKCGRR